MMPMDDENELFALTGEQPSAPPIGDLMKSMSQTPPTDYSFYKDISSEDRAKLAQQLMEKQHSGGNLIASGLGGLGDAISNSYGGKNTTFQKDIMAGADQNTKDRLAQVDTQRAQRMQDAENDPAHPMAQSMRDTLKAAGLNVPSGMPVSMMLKIAGPLGDFAYKQAQGAQQQAANAETTRHNAAMEGQQSAALNQQNDLAKKAQKDKDVDNKREALTARSKVGLIDEIFHPEIGTALDEQAGINQGSQLPAIGQEFKHATGAIIRRRK